MEISKDLTDCLPLTVQKIMLNYPTINEIRMRKNCPLCFTVGNKNIVTDSITSKEEIEMTVQKLCRNSLHTFFDSIKKGFIPFENGYRIGVCGQAVAENNIITNISEINSLNIRIPVKKTVIPSSLLNSIPSNNGTLIYSSANYGKTTLLREIIKKFSLPPHNKRIAVIDTKNEIYSAEIHSKCPVDFFISYPKYEAMNIAIQTMSPEIIVCDEIGIQDEVSSLIQCKNCGVTLICSTHAKNLSELLSRKNIAELYKNNIFSTYIGIDFVSNKRVYNFKTQGEIHI